MTPRSPSRTSSAFTFVEMVVALAIGAGVLVVAVLAYGAIFRSGLPSLRDEEVQIPAATMLNFYGTNTTSLAVSRAPNLTAAAMAESLGQRFREDVSKAVAVYCLGRDGLNSLHPAVVLLSETNDVRTWTDRNNFRALLPNSNTFTTNTNAAIRGSNLSIYLLGPSTNMSQIPVLAVYDADLVTNTTPAGVYASVRRYEGSTFTDFYHVFYTSDRSTVTNSFWPLACYYPRNSANCTNARPFYLVWWPDPASSRLPPATNGSPGTNVRAAYTNMGGQSTLSFVIPAFPAL